jgi:hypothetical protein
MQHARYECASGTLRRTLNRRSSSTYEASGFFSVTSASSDFSAALPSTAICSSCKPALALQRWVRCSTVCAAAEPSVTRRLFYAAETNCLMAPRQCRKSVSSCSCARRACVPACAPASRTCARGGIMQDATGSMQLATDNIRHATADTQHTACNMQQATCNLRPSPRVEGDARPMPCDAQRVAARRVRRSYCNSHATGFRQRATHNTRDSPPHTHTYTRKALKYHGTLQHGASA